ncbi:MAG: 7-carboxy-7-deazaguanine synthase QueE [Gammaproteobacteria bacterium]|nr:7-carboxy-7-deazaguanine synthase QueE [Gammaproteobacteria bacterium]
MSRLRITEIFYSLQGESRTVGLPTVFIRLTGCPLRCDYCDTTYAFKGGEWMSLDKIVDEVAALGGRHVTVTGGEPLAQTECLVLLSRLCNQGYKVSLETCGALDMAGVDPRVIKVMDLKTPGSGEAEHNRWENIQQLVKQDQVKFVICDEADYQWACDRLMEHHLEDRCELLFSPALGQLDATTLAEWIIRDRLQVRFQIQLHKYLWGDSPGK